MARHRALDTVGLSLQHGCELQGRRRVMEWGQRESRADKVSATADRLDLPLFTGAGPRLQGVETRPQADPATCQ